MTEYESQMHSSSGGYTYVKGGRFSKSNLKKRNAARQQETEYDESEDEQDATQKSADKGLLIAFIVLLISVIAVVCYILVKFLSPDALDPNANKNPGNNPGQNETVSATQSGEQTILCEDISFAQETVSFDKKDSTYQIEVTVTPADTTEVISFTSGDTNVVTVSETGLVTVVGEGETFINVTCGNVTKSIAVTCVFQAEDPTVPSVPTIDVPVVPAGFELNRTDFTLFKKGESWTLYSGSIAQSEITWTSSDIKVATVTNGKVTAVSTGRAVITAEYQGTKFTCIVHCSKTVGEYVESGESGDTQDQPAQNNYKLNTDDGRNNDITIYVGDSYTLKLLDANGNVVDAEFTSSDNGVCTVSGGTVTGAAAGKANITATFGGETHTCIVRVRER